MSDVKEQMKKLIKEVMHIDIEKIDNNKDLSKISEWDSFNNLMLISKVEKYFNIKFTVKDIEDVNTVNKILKLVESKVKK